MITGRSKSVPAAARTIDQAEVSEDESSNFPAFSQEQPEDQRVPSWIQELANARAGRSSRASSIVSTRTRFSTTTFDDARSVEIQAGSHSFRIGRFGDRITDTTAPPPYSGPHDDGVVEHSSNALPTGEAGARHEHDGHRPYHHFGGRGGRRHPRRVRIAMPGTDDDSGMRLDGDHPIASDTPSRVITDNELRQIILDLPDRLKRELGIDAERATIDPAESPPDASSPVDTADVNNKRKATSLPHTTVSTSTHKPSTDFQVRSILRKPPENTQYHTEANCSLQKTSKWPFTKEAITQRLWNTYNNANTTQADAPYLQDENSTAEYLDLEDDMEADESSTTSEFHVPQTVGDLNELSQAYSSLMRQLDRDHRKKVHEQEKELAKLRILLHEKDMVYRLEMKGKDFIIEDLKKRLDHSEEMTRLRIEQAVHATEDLWEERWKDHNRQLMEKCGLIKPTLHAYVSNATQTDHEST